jgi:hypothetical protein
VNDIAPLLYLEARMAVNKFRRVLHQPGRLALWIIFIAWFGIFLFTRVLRVSSGQYLLIPDAVHYFLAFVPALYIAILGMQIRSGAMRPPAAFSYPADSRFLFGSRLSHVLVVFWLQLRETAFQGSRLFMILFFFSWNLAATTTGLVVSTIALLSAYIIGFGLRLPVFLIQRRVPRAPFATFGVALVACGALTLLFPLALGFVSGDLSLAFIAAHTFVFPPGLWIVRALMGDIPALLVLAGLASVVIAAGSIAASDAYPELWEASSRLYARRSLAASGRGLWNREAWRELRELDPDKAPAPLERVASVSGEHAPLGSLTVFWKEWIALRRAPGGLRWPIFWLVGACLFGYIAGIAAANLSFFVLLGPLVALANIVIIIGSQSTISLGGELRRPMFWLGHSRLRNRVLAWILGTTLRIGPPLVVAIAVGGIAMRSWITTAAAAPIIIVGLFLVQSIGVASYVVLPGRNDLRGPGFMLRIFATYVLIAPPAIAWAFAQLFSQSAVLGLTAGLAVAYAEAWALVTFAASRLQQNAMVYAAAEGH